MVRRTHHALLSAAIALALLCVAAGCGSASGDAPPSPRRVLDMSYGVAGKVAFTDGVSSIALAPDGSAFVASSFTGIFYRVDAMGAMTGPQILPVVGYGLVADKDGNAYAAFQNTVFKFNAAGPDSGYADSGMALAYTPPPGVGAVISSLVPLPEGSLYVIIRQSQDPLFWDALVIVKLGPDGRPVASFGEGGRVTHHLASMTSLVFGAVDSAGNLYVSFWNGDGRDARMNLAKFGRDGQLVSGFGSGGVWSGTRTRCAAWAPAIDSAGFVWLPGECTDASGAFGEVLVKLDSNGQPVAGFGKDGYLDGFYGTLQDKSGESIAQRMVIAPDGTMYVSGYAVLAGCVVYRVVALDPQGNRIASFGTDGTLLGGRLAALDAANRLYVVSRTSSCGSGQTRDVLSRYL